MFRLLRTTGIEQEMDLLSYVNMLKSITQTSKTNDNNFTLLQSFVIKINSVCCHVFYLVFISGLYTVLCLQTMQDCIVVFKKLHALVVHKLSRTFDTIVTGTL